VRASFALCLLGGGLALGQLIWPLRTTQGSWVSMLPLIAALPTLTVGLVLGVARGTRAYRRAVLVGVVGLVAIAYGFSAVSFGQPGAPRPQPSMNEIMLFVGLALEFAAIVLGARAASSGATASDRERRGSGGLDGADGLGDGVAEREVRA
jgi:hypothetical protein